MKERKVVKLRVDMFEDTKFKIIDTKLERDLIHYVWTRLLTLAGKVNLEGDLYMSKNLQYTIETLAIEFNRATDQIKLALDVFIELEMIELNEGNVYRVKNFAKHQNIKVEEKIKSIDVEVKNMEIVVEEALKNEICDNGQDNIPILWGNEGNKNINKKKKKEKIYNMNKEAEVKDKKIVCFQDGEKPLEKGEKVIASWVF